MEEILKEILEELKALRKEAREQGVAMAANTTAIAKAIKRLDVNKIEP